MIRYLIFLVIFAMLITPASAEIIRFNQSHGETWIKWAWELNSTDYGANESFTMYLDGRSVFTYALNVTPRTLIPDYYYLTNLDANEQHSAKLVLSNSSTIPFTTIDTKLSTVTTSQPISYYYMVLVVIILLFFASLVLFVYKVYVLGILFDAGVAVFSGYLAITSQGFNTSFSIISLILCVISLAILVYFGYGIYDDRRTWRD